MTYRKYIITHWEGDQVTASVMRQGFSTHPDSNILVVKFKELMGLMELKAKE